MNGETFDPRKRINPQFERFDPRKGMIPQSEKSNDPNLAKNLLEKMRQENLAKPMEAGPQKEIIANNPVAIKSPEEATLIRERARAKLDEEIRNKKVNLAAARERLQGL